MLPSKIKKTGFPRVLSNLRCFKQNISSSSKLLSGHTHKKKSFSRQKHFPGKSPSIAFAKFGVMLEGEQSTFGTSAETGGTVSLVW